MLVTSNFNAHDLGDIAFDAVAGVRVAVAVRHFDDERPLARELVFKYDRGAFRDQLVGDEHKADVRVRTTPLTPTSRMPASVSTLSLIRKYFMA